MAYKYVKKETSALADGASETVSDVLEKPKHLEKIYITDNAGAAVNSSVAEIKIDSDLLTDPDAPCALMAPSLQQPFLIERDLTKGQTVYIKITNHEGSSKTFWAVLVYKS